MDKYVQKKTKTNWFKTIFVFVLSSVFSFAAFAVETWSLTDGKISISYNPYGSMGQMGESVQWQAGNVSIISQVVEETTGNTAWIPAKNEFFQINIEGTANFTGEISFYIADEREIASYWGNLSPLNEVTAYVQAGVPFSICETIQITQTTMTNGFGASVDLTNPDLVLCVSGEENSDGTYCAPKDIDGNYLSKETKCELTTTKFEIVYQTPANYENPLYIPYSHNFGEISYYKTNVESAFSSTIEGDYVNVHFTATAENDIDNLNYELFLAPYMGESHRSILDKTLAKNIKKGDEIDISFSIQINVAPNGRLRQQLIAEASEQALFVAFSNADLATTVTKKPLYAGPFVAEMPTAFELPYNVYSSDRDDDKIADDWQLNTTDILANYVFAQNGTKIFANMYDEYHLTMTATINGTGTLSIYLVDTREVAGYWSNISAQHAQVEVTEGVEFSIDETFFATKIEKDGVSLEPNIVLEFKPTVTSSMDGFDKTKKYIVTPSQFNIEYAKGGEQYAFKYNAFGTDIDKDGTADAWYNTFENIFTNAVNNNTWSPKAGDNFTVALTGKADFSGTIQIFMIDDSEAANYWSQLSQNEISFDVVEGEEFSVNGEFFVTRTTWDGFVLTPKMRFEVSPTITSTMDGFDAKKTLSLYLNELEVTYTPAPTYAEVVEMRHNEYLTDIDKDGISDEFKSLDQQYRNVIDDAVFEATEETGWTPEIGETFTVTMEGFADFSGKIVISLTDQREEVAFWANLANADTLQVVEGENFSKIVTFTILHTEKDGVELNVPEIVFTARPDITSTDYRFTKDSKHLYLDNFSVEYTPAEPKPEIHPEDYSTILKLDKFPYSDNTWQYVDNAILTDVTTNAGYKWEYVSNGDKYIIHTKGVADFTGTIGFYAINSRGDWNLCSDFQNHSVEYGKEFEFYDTLIITDASTTMQLQLDAICDDNTDPASKHLYLNEYSVKYSNQNCRVIVYSNDVTDFYNIFTENGEAYKSLSNGRGVIEGVEPETVWENDFEAGYAFILAKGSLVTITATPTEYGEFYSWGDGSTDATITITVPDTDTLELMANFRQLEFINYGTFDGPEFKLRALDTTAIYLPEVIQASYGTPLTYKIVKENELVPTKISNDTLYFMPPVGAIGNHISISVEATLPNETSRVSEFRTSFYPVQRDSLFPTPQIALVTVSKESGKNLVVWQKFETDKIDHYNIYRETEIAGEYKKIAEVPYSETSIFEDTEADPLVRAWRYKISASPVDTRYTESELSKAHKTIHLTKNMGMNNTYNLIWDKYEGLDFSTFVVIRNYKVGTTEIYTDTIAEIPSNVNSYTDLNPQKRTISYYVAIKLKDTVDVNEYLKAEIGPFVLAMSNIAEIENEQDGDPTAIDNIENAIVVYAANKIIYVKNANKRATVYNIAGALVAQSQNDSDSQEIAVEKAGIYFVKIENKLYKVIVE